MYEHFNEIEAIHMLYKEKVANSMYFLYIMQSINKYITSSTFAFYLLVG